MVAEPDFSNVLPVAPPAQSVEIPSVRSASPSGELTRPTSTRSFGSFHLLADKLIQLEFSDPRWLLLPGFSAMILTGLFSWLVYCQCIEGKAITIDLMAGDVQEATRQVIQPETFTPCWDQYASTCWGKYRAAIWFGVMAIASFVMGIICFLRYRYFLRNTIIHISKMVIFFMILFCQFIYVLCIIFSLQTGKFGTSNPIEYPSSLPLQMHRRPRICVRTSFINQRTPTFISHRIILQFLINMFFFRVGSWTRAALKRTRAVGRFYDRFLAARHFKVFGTIPSSFHRETSTSGSAPGVVSCRIS